MSWCKVPFSVCVLTSCLEDWCDVAIEPSFRAGLLSGRVDVLLGRLHEEARSFKVRCNTQVRRMDLMQAPHCVLIRKTVKLWR